MAKDSWECEKLASGYVVTKTWPLGWASRREAEESAVGVVKNLIAWLGITKYQLVREEDE